MANLLPISCGLCAALWFISALLVKGKETSNGFVFFVRKIFHPLCGGLFVGLLIVYIILFLKNSSSFTTFDILSRPTDAQAASVPKVKAEI